MKVLIVEDDTSIRQSLQKGLTASMMVVDSAADGQTGYDMAVAEKYDVVVVDWMLPQLSGVEMCRKLRSEGMLTPILLLTAKDATSEVVLGLASGADDYLKKPFEFAELVARVRALGRRREVFQDAKLVVSDLTIDTHTYEVNRASKKIALSQREYALLVFLVQNRGMVFSSQQLAERVWEYESDILANTVQVYIGYLRQKIDAAFPQSKPLLETVRGFGYRITTDV